MKELSNRNYMLDAVKAVSAVGVVLVHFPFPGFFGKICSSVGVVGVIVFFLISGYQSYFDDAAKSEKIMRRFRRNFSLTAMAVGVYFLFTVVEQAFFGDLQVWAETWLLNPVTYVRMILLGDFSFIYGDHLWYMVALLYCYVALYFMEKYRLHRIFYKFIPLLLIMRILLETYTNSFSHFSWFDWHFSGNALVGGLPIMLLGNYIHCNEKRIIAYGRKFYLLCTSLSLVFVFLFVNVQVLEVDISQPFKISAAVWVFLFCLITPMTKPVPVLGKIGSRYSLHIYIWHFLFGIAFKNIFSAMRVASWVVEWCLPVILIVFLIVMFKVLTDLNLKNTSSSTK